LKPDFNERAKDWDKDPSKVERARLVAAAMRARLSLDKGMRALEYGCGTGLLSFALHDSLGHISLADSAPGMLVVLEEKIAAAGLDNMRPRLLDLDKDTLPAERFDLIYSLMTLHHVLDADKVLRCFHTLLDPGGALCIADLDREDGSFHGAGFEGHRGFDRQALQHTLQEIGFTKVRFETVTQVRRPVDGQMKDFPVFLCCGEKADQQVG
jgi:ubiquinone/menaquinone biosynthesis C-methylase UbiE